MGKTKLLVILAIGAHAISILLYLVLSTRPSGDGAGMLYVIVFFPAIWFFAVVLSVVILVVKNPVPDVWQRYRPLAFIFCTPVPLLLCFWGYYMYDSRFDDINQQGMEWSKGYVYEYKTTVDESADPMQIVTRLRKADSLSYSLRGDSALVRDSVWVYVDLKSRDTLRLERYRHDTLMQTISGTKH